MKLRTMALAGLVMWTNTTYAAPPTTLPLKMLGSDTLRQVTLDVISNCDLQPNINYLGTGSSNGGNAMKTSDQQVAPMSRFLNASECSAFASSPGQGVTIGLDGIGVFGADAAASTSCTTLRASGTLAVSSDLNGVPGIQCPICLSGQYAFTDFRDVLRVLYAGQSAHVPTDACSDADPTRTPAAIGGTGPATCGNNVVDSGEQCDGGNTANFDGCASNCVWEIGNENRCNSDLRRALVANYTNLFPAGCTNTNCTEVRHVFRRDDLSGTTDTFLTLLGLPQATGRTFCNGLELEDLDPIRRKCDSTEQVCATIPYANRNANANGGTATVAATDPAVSGGDLGLVQAITMPADTTKQYSASACGLGRFGFVPMPTAIAAISQKCPDGNSRSGNLCRAPLTNTSKYGCLAVQGTRPANRVFVNMDGRGYNLMARDPDTGGLLSTLAGITDPRWGGGGVYRIHQTVSQAKAPAGWLCKETDATLQIGCLVIASPCSVSYAGREALFAGLDLVKAFVLRSPSNTADVPLLDENIRRLLDPVGASGGACVQGNGNNFGLRYALSRRLWINTEKGFGLPDFSNISDVVNGTVQTKEKMLAKCMADRTITDQAIVENNFTTITDRNCSAGVCDPNELDLDYRSRSCTPRCGDGIRQSNEGCDDGNVVSGDGCSATCVIEP